MTEINVFTFTSRESQASLPGISGQNKYTTNYLIFRTRVRAQSTGTCDSRPCQIGKACSIYRHLIGKHERKRSLGRPGNKHNGNIKMNLKNKNKFKKQ